MKKRKTNLYVRTGYGLSFFLALPILVILLGMLFDSRAVFKPKILYSFIPSLVYFLYIHIVIRNFYKKKLKKRIDSLTKRTIIIDEMVSDKVEITNFNYLGLGANVSEYFFTIYNKSQDKYFRISSVANKPNYVDVFIPDWKGKEITIYIDPEELQNQKKGRIAKKNKNTLWIFRFSFGKFNLEDNYKYSISENIARKGLFEGYLLLFGFLFVCVYVMIRFL